MIYLEAASIQMGASLVEDAPWVDCVVLSTRTATGIIVYFPSG